MTRGCRDFVSQPGDMSFVLSQLLEASSTTTDPLAGAIDAYAWSLRSDIHWAAPP